MWVFAILYESSGPRGIVYDVSIRGLMWYLLGNGILHFERLCRYIPGMQLLGTNCLDRACRHETELTTFPITIEEQEAIDPDGAFWRDDE